MTIKNVSMPEPLKERLREYAFAHRTSMADMIRSVIIDYANGEFSVEAPPARPKTVDLKIEPPEEYDRAFARARAEGVPFFAMIRDELERRMDEDQAA